MNTIIIIRQDGFGISIHKVVADRLGLKDGQQVDDKTANEALFENISHGLALSQAMTTNQN